jgi:hypothetical protein
MLTLKASTNAMRKAGINLGVQEVESVMSELDEQMREAQDVTSVLSNPLLVQQGAGMGGIVLEDAELDAELDLLEAVGGGSDALTLPTQRSISAVTHDNAARIQDESRVLAIRVPDHESSLLEPVAGP